MLTQVLNLVGQYFPGCHFCCFKRIHFNSGFRITAIVKYNKVKGLDKKKQLSTTREVNKKALVDLIKKAAKNSSSKGRLIDLRDPGAQRDSKTPYPASNTQSDT
jgi:hypothetical protein